MLMLPIQKRYHNRKKSIKIFTLAALRFSFKVYHFVIGAVTDNIIFTLVTQNNSKLNFVLT